MSKYAFPESGYVYPESGTASLYCNNCGAHIEWPDRGIVPFDGRFCGYQCKDEFDLKRSRYIMGKR